MRVAGRNGFMPFRPARTHVRCGSRRCAIQANRRNRLLAVLRQSDPNVAPPWSLPIGRPAWPNAAACHASKWGLLGFSHALHVEARPRRVKVTAVISGGVRMPLLRDRFADLPQETLQETSRLQAALAAAIGARVGS